MHCKPCICNIFSPCYLAAFTAGETLCEHSDFVSTFLPPVNPKHRKKASILASIRDIDRRAVLHIPSSIDVKASVFYYIIIIQCLVRCRSAWKQRKVLIKCNEAFAKLQRKFRQRSAKLHKSAFLIQAFFHFVRAKKVVGYRKRESHAAQVVQRGFRCFVARMELFRRRCVPPTDICILWQSSFAENHGAEKLVDFKTNTFYMSKSREFAQIKFEFRYVSILYTLLPSLYMA